MIIGAPALSPTMASRKLQVLAFIESYYAARGVGPSMREIAAAIGSNFTRAQEAVHKLAKEGRIYHQRGVARSVRPLSAEEEAMRQLRRAGYVVTKSGLPAGFVLDHLPDPDEPQEITQSGQAAPGDRRDGQAAQ